MFRWNFQAQMDVIRHGMPFKNLHFLLLTQISKDPSNSRTQFPVYYLSPILRNEYNVILALPSHVRQRLETFHTLFLLQPGRAFQRKSVFYSRRTGIAFLGLTAKGRGFSTH